MVKSARNVKGSNQSIDTKTSHQLPHIFSFFPHAAAGSQAHRLPPIINRNAASLSLSSKTKGLGVKHACSSHGLKPVQINLKQDDPPGLCVGPDACVWPRCVGV